MMDFNYCPYCGKKQKKRKKLGLNLKAKGQTIPNGFIEILYEEGSRKMDSPEAPNSLGRFRVFADGDMEWMYPITGALSPSHVLYLGLSNFLNENTLEHSAIHLHTEDIHAVNSLLDKKELSAHPDEAAACRYVKRMLKSRPLITIKFLEARLLREKLGFMKARFNKEQQGRGIEQIPDTVTRHHR